MKTILHKTFEINKSQEISHEIFKDEIIVINLKSGIYFQIENSGIEIFKNIKNNILTEENVRSFVPQNAKNKLEILKFINLLKKHHIIKETSIKNWNVDNFSKTEEFIIKQKETCLEKWGEDHHLIQPLTYILNIPI